MIKASALIRLGPFPSGQELVSDAEFGRLGFVVAACLHLWALSVGIHRAGFS